MNKSLKTARRSQFTFGDLIVAVSSVTRNRNEVALAVNDLLSSGRVVLGRPQKRHHR